MNRINIFLKLFVGRCRLLCIQIFNPKASVKIKSGGIIIPWSSDIEVASESNLRIGHSLSCRKNVVIAVRKNASLIIGDKVFINRNTIITSRKYIAIGNGVTIGPNVCIYDHDHNVHCRGDFNSESIVINSNVWIGSNVIILKGVTIGKGSVIASGCIVTKDVPENTILIQKRDNFLRPLDGIKNKGNLVGDNC